MEWQPVITGVFLPIFNAVLAIFLVGLVSTFLVRRKYLTQNDIYSLSQLTVILLMPCLIFSNILLHFKPDDFQHWYLLPVLAIGMILVGMGLYWLISLRKPADRRAMMVVSGFMNANFLVLPIGKMAFPEQFDRFATYTFLIVIGVNPALWSFGKYMLTSNEQEPFRWKSIITVPLIASILAITLVLLHWQVYIPRPVVNTIDFIGQATIPIATIVLGATLGNIKLHRNINWGSVFKVVAVKLFLMPVLTIAVLYYTRFRDSYPLLADLLVLQAAVAPATTLILQVRKYGGNTELVGTSMLINYLLCLLTIPLWMTLWRMLA